MHDDKCFKAHLKPTKIIKYTTIGASLTNQHNFAPLKFLRQSGYDIATKH
jgi:hypothetical protein